MTYRVQILPLAQRDFKRLRRNKKVLTDLRHAVWSLGEDPRPPGVKNLLGNIYRIRVGNYRIIYQVEDNVLLILVLHLGPRNDVYRGLNELLRKYLK